MEKFDALHEMILSRRNIKPEAMNGRVIEEKVIRELLELANWAPTHGHTEPWRFVVFSGDAMKDFSRFHADLYKELTPDEKFQNVKYEKILHRTANASHLIAVVMKRGNNDKIPEIEEIAATSIAAYNIWLGVSVRGIACYWGSGGMTYHDKMREKLGFGPEDRVMGFLHLGYSDTEFKGRRLTDIGEKVKWIS